MSTIKNAKYRIKDENGNYQIVHFETSMKQVQGLDEKVAEVEGLIADRYSKTESDAMFRTVNNEIDAVEAVAEGLNTRLTSVESEVVGLKGELATEIARAEGVEADLQAQINGLEGQIEAINHPESGILKQANDYTDSKIADVNTSIEGLEGQLGASNTELEGKITDLVGTVEANKVAIEGTVASLEGRLVGVTGRVDGLEGNVADLREEDTRLATEIQNIKDVIAGQGSDTKVFATMDEFLAADLSPKVGDLAFIIQNKRSYIYKGADAPMSLDLPTPPAGWVLFDEISSTIDLVDYAKKAEVEALIAVLDAKVVAETERAQGAEQALNDAIDALKLVVAGNGEKITVLEGTVAAQGEAIEGLAQNTYTKEEVDAIVNDEVALSMNVMSATQPTDIEKRRIGHVWIELM